MGCVSLFIMFLFFKTNTNRSVVTLGLLFKRKTKERRWCFFGFFCFFFIFFFEGELFIVLQKNKNKNKKKQVNVKWLRGIVLSSSTKLFPSNTCFLALSLCFEWSKENFCFCFWNNCHEMSKTSIVNVINKVNPKKKIQLFLPSLPFLKYFLIVEIRSKLMRVVLPPHFPPF